MRTETAEAVAAAYCRDSAGSRQFENSVKIVHHDSDDEADEAVNPAGIELELCKTNSEHPTIVSACEAADAREESTQPAFRSEHTARKPVMDDPCNMSSSWPVVANSVSPFRV